MLPQDQVRNGCLMAAEERWWGIEARMGVPPGQGALLLCSLLHPEVTTIH